MADAAGDRVQWPTALLAVLLGLLAFGASLVAPIAAYALWPYASPILAGVLVLGGVAAFTRSEDALVRAVGAGAAVGGLIALLISLFLVADTSSDTEIGPSGLRRP